MSDDAPKLRGFVIGEHGIVRDATPEDMQGIEFRVCGKPGDPRHRGAPSCPTICYFCGVDLVFNPFEVLPRPAKHVCRHCIEGEISKQQDRARTAKAPE